MNERPNMFAQNDTPISIHERVELPDEQLRSLAPSVFAAQAMPGVSSRYAFVPTAHLVARLRNAGWAPVSAVEQRIKIEDRRGFQKHLIRFQRRDVVPVKGEYTPELCLINSHDCSSAYQLHAGSLSVHLRQRDVCRGRQRIRESLYSPRRFHPGRGD